MNLNGKKKTKFVHQFHEKVRANIEKWTMQYATQVNKGAQVRSVRTRRLDLASPQKGMFPDLASKQATTT